MQSVKPQKPQALPEFFVVVLFCFTADSLVSTLRTVLRMKMQVILAFQVLNEK